MAALLRCLGNGKWLLFRKPTVGDFREVNYIADRKKRPTLDHLQPLLAKHPSQIRGSDGQLRQHRRDLAWRCDTRRAISAALDLDFKARNTNRVRLRPSKRDLVRPRWSRRLFC